MRAKPRRSRTARVTFGGGIAVALLGVAAYLNTLSNGLVAGDLQFIADNDAIRHVTVLETAFTHGYWWTGGDPSAGTYYRPFTVLLDALDELVWRGQASGFHLTNLVLHVIASLFVLRLARAFTRSHVVAIGAALLFAVHPIHVGATSYVSARSAILSTIAACGAVIAALAWRRDALPGGEEPPSSRPLWVALGWYVGGLLSAEASITIPALVLVAAWPPGEVTREARSRWTKRATPAAIAFAVVTAAYLAVRHGVLGGVFSAKEELWRHLDPVPFAMTMAKIDAYYAVKLVLPTDLSYLPPFVPVIHASDLVGIASLAAVVGAAGFVIAGPARLARYRMAIAWAIVTLLPVSGVLPLDHLVRAHYAYLPSVGFCVLVAMLARAGTRTLSRTMPGRTARIIVGGAGAVILAGGLGATVFANLDWRSTAALDARVLELEPEIPDEVFAHPSMTPTANRFAIVHITEAAALANAGRCDLALPHAERARKLTRRRTTQRDAQQIEDLCGR